ncbi:bifunctional salicylyl-CoA 5-hydroxylase/oxidoreductase [Pseudenhygromyxa sp. WMMC2535]|uniref:bifunctional salicylyl-CoA 5-hydroxylase/oxidoreductase n=1 Tax=Pseudenhygromyxa sp. WMMC2535 TaxID=2712867 RepID=UPI001552A9BB|nr:bifunctional salicylyl-CoA 5-hydroxylase/oxidoreductase [Pseudenhygromyxa sp. WMMC2535]NVB37122.1 bifunctional salicylyl-CoA 5-hydroxylase/oxidoreductase [Pseudenhygromyxa sp. WMMC2535]
MKVGIVGGGPAGLYSAILLKKALPTAEVTVVEKNPEGVTWGWGVVFSEQTMGHFAEADAQSFVQISRAFSRWDAIDTYFKGEKITSRGHDFAGIRRVHLLNILTERARELGVTLRFGSELEHLEDFAGCDLIIAADGVNSKARARFSESFEPTITTGRSRYIWLGSDRLWDAFTFIIRNNEHGLFQVHAYRFDTDTSTFIVECDEASWRNAGLHEADEAASIAYCEQLFAPELAGAKLMGNRSRWLSFPELVCGSWRHLPAEGEGLPPIVIIGDAAHTAHFSIGSGTKLAMEDAIELVAALTESPELPVRERLGIYEERRRLDVAKLQRAARVSQRWFEDISRYEHFEPQQLVVSMMTRSKRVTHENLRVRDPRYVDGLDRWFAAHVGNPVAAEQPVPPPMFQPFRVGALSLSNRVVVSPMCQYSASEGVPNDWHLVHIGSRAIGGAGLVICEMTDVSPQARISPGCAGLWNQAQVEGWRRVVDFCHANSDAKIGVQIGHAGRKGGTEVLWKGGRPLPPDQAWELVAPSPLAWDQNSQTPRALTSADMREIRAQYVQATRHAAEAGFDLLELHAAHGYLLSSFISPLTNQREDTYGGELEGRMRFPLEIWDACREVWPSERPMSVRISATDWMPGGLSEDEAVEVARLFHSHGCDLIDVSAGQTHPDAKPIYGRMFQTPFSDRIRNELRDVATMAVGNIQGWDHINTIVVSGRADLCALARPHLYDPYLTLHAAAEQGWHRELRWPDQYLAGRSSADLVASRRGES